MDYQTTEYDGIKIEEYNGVFSLTAQRVKDDNFYPVWAKYKKNKTEYQAKDWPVKVILGDKEKAKTVLLNMLAELGEPSNPDDVPF